MRRGDASIRTENGRHNFVQDDFLIFEISTGREQGYVSIVYVSADDSVRFISRDSGPVPAGTVLNIGDGKQLMGSLFVSPPFGGELALLLVSPTPIFNAEAPETADDLLNVLQRGDAGIAAAYVLFETRPEV
ncbi:DUF4384 domain-containing protein [Rhizobium sp. L1K21]|uniref:DUF4384 domain-containing protein n=1 Tax=Rhizobium sp. L1K21 TaxID=2954933 RepID=UPI0020935EA0|nr:DUF4384 domain-containing protein [Rhizobium sp. L1K21]MCO6188231.1 DUF4384 domain-containing protein [Rhizobium sp. L1K21]